MKVTLSGGHTPGKVSKSIQMRSNDRDNAITNLVATLSVASALKFEPSALNLGRIERDAPEVRRTVKVRRGDGGPINPKLVVSSNSSVHAELREIREGEEYEVDVVVSPPFPNNSFNAVVALQTGVEKSPQEALNITAQIAPRVTAVPSFFAVLPDEAEEQKIRVQLNWSGGTPARILETSVTDATVTVEVGPESGTQEIVITVPPNYTFPPGTPRRVTLKLDDPSVPQLTIPIVSAKAVPRPTRDANLPQSRQRT